ncbi:MAG: Txe/YoeB family addiction module toxin [Gillisia sp.]
MGKYIIELSPVATKELIAHKKSGNKSSISKLEKIFKELSTTPYSGTGKPEALKHDLTGFWSRRINLKDRLIYKVSEQEVKVLVVSAIGHYEK